VERGQPPITLSLLDGFELCCDREIVHLPMSAQRLLACLALHDRPLPRPYVAAMLWLDSSDARAAANLRSALWRLHQPGYRLIETDDTRLRLSSDLRVDVRDLLTLAHRLIDGSGDWEDVDVDSTLLVGEVLPDWYEDWVLIQRERFRKLSLHALEALAAHLTEAGRLGDALEAALAAVSRDPLRESAHCALINVHLAEGNGGEALRQFRFCRRLLADRLGIAPSPRLKALVRNLPV